MNVPLRKRKAIGRMHVPMPARMRGLTLAQMLVVPTAHRAMAKFAGPLLAAAKMLS